MQSFINCYFIDNLFVKVKCSDIKMCIKYYNNTCIITTIYMSKNLNLPRINDKFAN